MTESDRSNIGDISDDLKASLDKLALASRILEMEGHGNFTLGHLAFRDPEGRGVWIKRWGMTLGEVQDWTDHQLIDFDGNLLYGDGNKRHSEWPIHVGIYKRRPDINASAYTHPRYGTVFSRPASLYGHRGIPAVSLPSRRIALPENLNLFAAPEWAMEMAEVLDDNYAMFLRNHGVVFCGPSIEKMIIVGTNLETACQQQPEITASGMKYDWPDGEERQRKAGSMGDERNIGLFFDYFVNKLAATQQLGDPNIPLERRNAR